MNRLAFWIPLALFLLFAGIAGYMLTQPRDEVVKSALIGQPLPPFDLPGIAEDDPRLATAFFTDGRPRLVNLWASWCLPCIAEAPQLAALERAGAPIIGIAVRDTPEDIAAFLDRHGDPYIRVARDDISEVAVGLGASGYPETYVVDGAGIVRYQHIGEIRARDVSVLLEELERAR